MKRSKNMTANNPLVDVIKKEIRQVILSKRYFIQKLEYTILVYKLNEQINNSNSKEIVKILDELLRLDLEKIGISTHTTKLINWK